MKESVRVGGSESEGVRGENEGGRDKCEGGRSESEGGRGVRVRVGGVRVRVGGSESEGGRGGVKVEGEGRGEWVTSKELDQLHCLSLCHEQRHLIRDQPVQV